MFCLNSVLHLSSRPAYTPFVLYQSELSNLKRLRVSQILSDYAKSLKWGRNQVRFVVAIFVILNGLVVYTV